MTTNESDTGIAYNTTLTLWKVINDWDMIARVPFTPCILFNDGARYGCWSARIRSCASI